MEKILFIAAVESHILNFHIPYIYYFKNRRYEVHIAVKLGNRRDEFKDMGVVCHNIDFSRSPASLKNIKALKMLINTMKENKFSLVHVHTPVGGFLGRAACSLTNTHPVLYTAHGFHFYRGAPLKNWVFYYTLEKIASRWTDGLILLNNEDYSIGEKFKLREKEACFLVNGVGVDLEKYSEIDNIAKNILRQEYGYSEEDFIILAVAELIERKNFKQIIDAVGRIKSDKNIYCLIVGEGRLEDNLKEYVKYNKLDKRIVFMGFRFDIPKLLNICDVLLLTSLHEGLPKAIMEAMAAGKPIIATDVRGNRDLVSNGENGYLVRVNDVNSTEECIEELLSLKTLRAAMGSKSRELIEKYSLKRVEEDMDKIYTRFLSRAK